MYIWLSRIAEPVHQGANPAQLHTDTDEKDPVNIPVYLSRVAAAAGAAVALAPGASAGAAQAAATNPADPTPSQRFYYTSLDGTPQSMAFPGADVCTPTANGLPGTGPVNRTAFLAGLCSSPDCEGFVGEISIRGGSRSDGVQFASVLFMPE
jgi:hypothetical protein